MSDSADRQLIDLVSREQRGLRQILIAGITTLVVVVMMSAGLGVYYSAYMGTQRRADQEGRRRAARDAQGGAGFFQRGIDRSGTATACADRAGLDQLYRRVVAAIKLRSGELPGGGRSGRTDWQR